jgi:hypothetical protein
MKKYLSTIILSLIILPLLAEARYCIYNNGLKKDCFDNLAICKKYENENFRRNDECRKEEEQKVYAKDVMPKDAKPESCLWMKHGKKWKNLGCMESKAQCKYAEKHYSSQAEVKCR